MKKTRKPKYYVAQTGGSIRSGLLNNISDPVTAQFLQQTTPAQNPWTINDNGIDAPRSYPNMGAPTIPQQPINTSATLPAIIPDATLSNPGTYNIGNRPKKNKANTFINGFNGVAQGVTAIANQFTNNKLNRTEQQQLLQANQRFQQAPQGPLNTNPAYTQYGGVSKYQVGGQTQEGGLDYSNPDYDDYSGDMLEQLKSGGWIKGAVNPAHKGYCTPMTKSTCTPRRKAFAMTMKKHHGFHKAQIGGQFSPEEQSLVDAYTSKGYNVTKDPASGQLKYVKNGVTANPATAANNVASKMASQAASGHSDTPVIPTPTGNRIPLPDYNDPSSRMAYAKAFRDKYGKESLTGYGDVPLRVNEKPSWGSDTSKNLATREATRLGLDPATFYASSMIEGQSGLYPQKNKETGKETVYGTGDKDYPVSALWSFGLDSLSDRLPELKKKGYLPQDFDKNFKTFTGQGSPAGSQYRQENEMFNTADAGIQAKAAMMRDYYDELDDYSKKKNIKLDPQQRDFFALAHFNSGAHGYQMLDAYNKAGVLKNDNFLTKMPDVQINGMSPSLHKQIYGNVSPRLAAARGLKEEGLFDNTQQAVPTGQTGQMKAGGTITRKEDYGSKSHPYPSVPSGEFAGGHRSYPIPTKENAKKALYLAHIHHRPDVIAKVHAKYPGLKQNQVGGFGGGPHDDLITNDFMAKTGGWIKGAINPAHKGYCTPMTKSTCTPRRKALARRFKSGDLSHHQAGGDLYNDVSQYEIDNNMLMQTGGLTEGLIPTPRYNFAAGITPNANDSSAYRANFQNLLSGDTDAKKQYNLLGRGFTAGSSYPAGDPRNAEQQIWEQNMLNAYNDASNPNVLNSQQIQAQLHRPLILPPDTKRPSKHQTGGVPQVQGLDGSQAASANVEAEKGEVFTTQNGNMGQVDPNGATHEQGGEMLPQVSRVLENTSNLRKDKVSKYLRLNPEQIKALTGLDTNSSMSHAEALIKGQENLEKQKNNIISKIQLAAKGNNGTGLDMYAENSTKFNIDHFRAMPTKQELFNRLFDHQEMTKNALGISNDGGMQTAQYGGRYIMQAGGITAYSGNISGQLTPAGNSDAFQGDLNEYLGKLKANGFKFDNIHSNADLQRALYANELKNNPAAIKNMWQEGIQNYGLDKAAKAGFVYTEDDPTKGVKKGQFKPGVLDKPENLQKLADLYPDNLLGRRILDLSANKGPKVWNDNDLPPIPNNPQAGVTNPDPSIKNNVRLKQNPQSDFNEPLNWYDTASATNSYLGAQRRLPENFNRVDVHQLNLKLLDPTAALRANQGDFNAAVQATQQADPNNTGAQMANIANLTARKYALNNQVMGNYDQQNAGIKNQEITYNTQAKDKQSAIDAQAREDFSGKVLVSKAKQQEQKLTALDGLYKTIADNAALNRNGNLIMKMSRAFDQYGNYNGYAPSFQPNPQLGISSNPSTNATTPAGKYQPAGGIQGLTPGKNYYNRRTGKTLRFDGTNLTEVK